MSVLTSFAEMGCSLFFFLLLLFEAGKLYKNILMLCYDEERMHEAIERASHEKYTEQKMLVSVIEYIAGHKFFASDPRNGQVHIGVIKQLPVDLLGL